MTPRGGSVLGACVAWVLSAGPFVLDASVFSGASRLALAALPWVACAGLPTRALGNVAREVAFECALFLPPLALGAALDLAGGAARADVLWIGGALLAFALGLAFASRAAAGQRRTRAWHALAWIVLVAGIPVLFGVLERFGTLGLSGAPAWLARIAETSPITWTVGQLSSSARSSSPPWLPLGLVLAFVALGIAARGVAREEAS